MPTRMTVIVALAIGVFSGTQAFAQAKNWTDEGPGPMLMTSNTVLPPMNPAAGAINAIVPSPTSADVIFVGTVNGGVWKTSNATATSPTWEPLTDKQLPALSQLSIKSLAMSPVNSNTLFAGTGSTSSLAGLGGTGIGVARSTDGGTTWTVLNCETGTNPCTPIFTGRTITSIVPTTLNGGATVLAATWEMNQASLEDKGGVYMSTDDGNTFTRISGNAKWRGHQFDRRSVEPRPVLRRRARSRKRRDGGRLPQR
jgi:hypothetical protein